MKELMSGNEAIARGAYEAGCLVAAAYPGTPSTEILENMGRYPEIYSEWSTNEKVALEVAAGSAIAGVRSLAAMKHVGMNVAADPMFTVAYTGVSGGLVIVTADDPGCHSSQNEQDNRYYALAAKIAMLEPADSAECKDFTKAAFDISEQFDIPVILRVTTRICHSKSLVMLDKRTEVPPVPYEKNPSKYIMAPANAKIRHVIVEDKLAKLEDYAVSSPLNKIETGDGELGIIASGVCYHYAKEVFGDGASYLKLAITNPLPKKLIADFAKTVKKVIVIEENTPYLETEVKALGIDCEGRSRLPVCGELDPSIIRTAFTGEAASTHKTPDVVPPARPPMLCAGCPHRGLFFELRKLKNIIVSGDIGCYTLGSAPPLGAVDSVLCMGASISAGSGMARAMAHASDGKKVFSVIGDSTFFHSGITGLINAVYNRAPIAVIVADNSTTAMTGHQDNPGTGKNIKGYEAPQVSVEDLAKACGVSPDNIRTVDPYDLDATAAALKEAEAADDTFVIVARRECALLRDVRAARLGMYCEVDPEKCTKCKACVRLGCPAISMDEGAPPQIDRAQCNGCEMCFQQCKFGAIARRG